MTGLLVTANEPKLKLNPSASSEYDTDHEPQDSHPYLAMLNLPPPSLRGAAGGGSIDTSAEMLIVPCQSNGNQ